MFGHCGLMPVFPALLIFGFGILFLHYGKKQKSRWLKIGGYFLSIASIIIMLFIVHSFVFAPKHCARKMNMDDGYDMGFRHKRHMQFMMENAERNN